MQTRIESFIEVSVNTFIGYVIAVISQLLFFPMVGIIATLEQNLLLGILFTIVSLIRSYLVRRYFNRKSYKKSNK